MSVFEVPVDDEDVEFFEFKLPGSEKVHKIPLAAHITAGVADDLANGRTLTAIIAMGSDGETVEAIRSLKSPQVRALMKKWESASGVTPGESSAS